MIPNKAIKTYLNSNLNLFYNEMSLIMLVHVLLL